MSKQNGKSKSFWIDDHIAHEMNSLPEINWSEVARNAIEDRIKRERKMIKDMENFRVIQ